MTAVQRIEHVHVIELRLVIPGLLGEPRKAPERLKVYEEPEKDPEHEQQPAIEPAEGVAKMTTENYLQHEGILRKIVGKIEDLSGLIS